MARTLRKHYGWTTCALAALVFAGFHAFAIAGSKKDVPVDNLVDLLDNPAAYGDRDVAFYCRFAMIGKLFKEINTHYNSLLHINIAVWPHQSRLWEDDARRQLLPTLYIAKDKQKLVDNLRSLDKYDLLLIRGKVTAHYGNMPWINVTSIERLAVADERFPAAAIAQIRRGVELMNGDDPMEAKGHFDEALRIGVPTAHKVFVQARIAECWKKADMPIQSLAPLRQVSAELPNDPYPLLALAEAELAAGNPDAAIEAAKKALKITPRFGPAQSILGEAYGRQGLYSQGLEMVSLAEGDQNLHPKERAMLNVRRARIYIQARRYFDAVQSYAKAIGDGSPLSGEPWLRREIASLYEERFEATQQPELLDEAIREYKNANAFAPRGDAAALCRAAEAEYNRALRLNPGAPDYTAVREMLKLADSVQPAYPPARVLAARLLHLQGETARADAIFNDILTECANDPTGLLSLADTYEALGRTGAACDLYTRVLQMEPWNRRAADRRDRAEACRNPVIQAQAKAAEQATGYSSVVAANTNAGGFAPGIVLPAGTTVASAPAGGTVSFVPSTPRIEVATTDSAGMVNGPTYAATQPVSAVPAGAAASLPKTQRPATVSTWYLDD